MKASKLACWSLCWARCLGAMRATRAVHGPACATTLIIAPGLLPSPADGAVIMAAVALMFGAHRAGRKIATPN